MQAIAWVLECSESRLGARCVLISIANHAKADGTGSWPSVPTIAREARVSEREVQYATAELRRIGELIIQTSAGPRGSNLYSLPKMAGANFAGANTAPRKPPLQVVHRGAPEPSESEPSTTEPPVAPLRGGRNQPSPESFLEWHGQWIAIQMGNRHRLFTGREQEAIQTLRAEDLVAKIRAKGFYARLVPQEEVDSWPEKVTA